MRRSSSTPGAGYGGIAGPLGSPRAAADATGIWVALPGGRVERVDTNANTLVDPLVIAPPRDERADSTFSAIAVGEGGIWVLGDPNDRRLWRIDPATGKLAATIRLPFAPTDVAVGAGAVWVTSQLDDTVSRVDPAKKKITAQSRRTGGAVSQSVAAGCGSRMKSGAPSHALTRARFGDRHDQRRLHPDRRRRRKRRRLGRREPNVSAGPLSRWRPSRWRSSPRHAEVAVLDDQDRRARRLRGALQLRRRLLLRGR